MAYPITVAPAPVSLSSVATPVPSVPPARPDRPPVQEVRSANCMIPVLKSPQDYQGFRISPEDKNRIAIVFDPSHADISLAVCVEIFDPGGHTPRHRHPRAAEMFWILKGEGQVFCDGKSAPLRTGDSVMVPPNGNHALYNNSNQRLYALCIMVPNEDFIELVRHGIPIDLDAEDLAVLRGLGSGPLGGSFGKA
ncbi:cupin domain-containing protein [Prochlorothrix hollandica]|uniref:cupin domain-containing protein n=1 Tax=Prochlorothrix hollandica TaxID=1223 RepID=UPI0003824D59|nr:cupin domain-containing protein [Prochlorothrix hollandica]